MVGEAATGLRAPARFHVCSTMSHKPDPKPSQPLAVGAEVARMRAGAAPQLAAGVLGDICGGVVALVSGEPGGGQEGRAWGDRAAEGGRRLGGEGRGRGQGRTGRGEEGLG